LILQAKVEIKIKAMVPKRREVGRRDRII